MIIKENQINFDALKADLIHCKTDRQVLRLLDEKNIRYHFSDYEWYMESKEFSIFLDIENADGKFYRIYKTIRKEYVLQTMEKVTMQYSGIPVFFG